MLSVISALQDVKLCASLRDGAQHRMLGGTMITQAPAAAEDDYADSKLIWPSHIVQRRLGRPHAGGHGRNVDRRRDPEADGALSY